MMNSKGYYSIDTVIQALASACASYHEAKARGLTIWVDQWEAISHEIVKEYFPSGSGIDNGCKLDIEKSNSEKIVFHTAFHHMDEHGYYDGWTEHTVTIRPCFKGFDLKISGKDRNSIKDYLHETFYFSLGKVCRAISETSRVYEWVYEYQDNNTHELKPNKSMESKVKEFKAQAESAQRTREGR